MAQGTECIVEERNASLKASKLIKIKQFKEENSQFG